jgi:hypothetical protein
VEPGELLDKLTDSFADLKAYLLKQEQNFAPESNEPEADEISSDGR